MMLELPTKDTMSSMDYGLRSRMEGKSDDGIALTWNCQSWLGFEFPSAKSKTT